MARSGQLEALLDDRRINAAIGWALLAFVTLGTAESVADADWVWVVISAFVVVLAAVPPVVYRNPRVMVPWEVLGLATLPMLARSLAGPGTLGEVAAYLSVAAVALIIAVELDVFTSVRMTTSFAVVFVVIATMATAGGWAVVQWLSDVYLGTTLVTSLQRSMWGFIWATVAGVGSGLLFDLYFRTRASFGPRLPEEVGGEHR